MFRRRRAAIRPFEISRGRGESLLVRFRVANEKEARIVGNVSPFMKIERNRGRFFDAGEERPKLAREGGERADCAIDMEPKISLAAILAMRSSGSMAPVFTVPAVATTKNGFNPSARSLAMASSSAATSIRPRASTATLRRFAEPMPESSMPRATHLCASAEV